MPLEGHYCCLLGGTTVAPLVLLLIPQDREEGQEMLSTVYLEEAFL